MFAFRAMLVMVSAALIATGCVSMQIDGDSEAVLVLEALASPGGTSRLESMTESPEDRPTSFIVAGEAHAADLYTPAEGRVGAIVLVPGLAPAGKDDARLTHLAETLARVGFEVLVPGHPGVSLPHGQL